MNKTIWIINHYALTPAQGGLSRHYFFARELQKRGYSVRIFTSSKIHNTDINMISHDEKVYFKDVEYEGVNYTYIRSSDYKGNGVSRVTNMLGFAFDIKKIWKKYSCENPSVIYTSTPDLFTAWQAERFAKKHKIPCVVEVRDLWPLSIVEYNGLSEANPLIRILYRLEKKIYSRADALVFTMEGGRDYVAEHDRKNKINPQKIFNINNGIDIEEQNKQRDNFIVDDPDLVDDSFKVIYTGSIRTANSVDMIVKTARILKENEKIKFLIFGDGNNCAELKNYCVDNGLTNVVFKGKVDKKYIPYICSCADLNILTYINVRAWKYGGSQNKMFDYMNAGKPILTNIKMGYSLLDRYACGLELGNNNAEDFAHAILHIYNLSADEYLQMCENAKKAVQEFDFKVLTNVFEDALQYAIEHYGEK